LNRSWCENFLHGDEVRAARPVSGDLHLGGAEESCAVELPSGEEIDETALAREKGRGIASGWSRKSLEGDWAIDRRCSRQSSWLGRSKIHSLLSREGDSHQCMHQPGYRIEGKRGF
jgi:hypothetical protein